MTAMYDVALINLTAEARSAGEGLERIDQPGLTDAALRTLLQNFREIDAIENAYASPEIRVRVRKERYTIRTGEKRLMLHDTLQRDLPALVLSLDEMMAELDGSAAAARRALANQRVPARTEAPVVPVLPPRPVRPASQPLVAALGVLAVALLGAIVYLQREVASTPEVGAPFVPVLAAELLEQQPKLIGVYMTGPQPGQHGIVIISVRELKLFELNAVAAPRLVYAAGTLGHAGAKLVLATDQPGGAIEIVDRDTLIYCDEIYRRVP